MGGDHRRRSQTKRRFRQVHSREEDELETVDDLAHAAQFAIFPVAPVAIAENGNPMKADDDNEIEVADDESNSDSCVADVMPNEPETDDDAKYNDDNSESGDGESDDDLTEALQRMEQTTAEEEANQTGTASNPPKTENEVDGYKASIQELESQLQIQLTVKGATNTAGTHNYMDVSINDVSPAGKLKNHMVLDRTVVVESILSSPASYQGTSGPLDEGSLLIIKKSDNIDNEKNTSKAIWIPLGRIFEVFGPVSQPLYTIRLPSPLRDEKKKPLAKSNLKTKHIAKQYERNGVEAEEAEANVCSQEEETQRQDEESKKGSFSLNELSKKRREVVSSSEQVHDADGKDGLIQSTSNNSQCQITKKETSDDPENDGLSSTILPTPSSDSRDKPRTVECEVKNENPANDGTENVIIDPWAIDGEYTVFLSQNKDIQVYYIQDEAKLIDTGLVLRTSGKGCDASNRYDEEILDSSEAYYSDDEKEREAKNKKKGGTRKKTLLRTNHPRQQPHQRFRGRQTQQHQLHAPTRFPNTMVTAQQGRPTLPPPPPPKYYGYGQHHGTLPQGFHRMTDQTKSQAGFQQSSSLYQYPTESSFCRHASIPPPPPPPPPRPHQSHPYHGTTPPPYPFQGSSLMPPPPPPSKNPNEPPTYQY